MKVSLFIPCYIDQFYPAAGIATLELLEKAGVEVNFKSGQACCGQPMANAGFEHLSAACHRNFERQFAAADWIVCPSGSCTLYLREHLNDKSLGRRTVELTEFLTDILKINSLTAIFPHRVGLHQSCHGQRGLGLSQMSELAAPPFSKTLHLLKMVSGIQLTELDRTDECCGFGGTFAVTEEAVSVKMGKDRVADHERHGAEFITAGDMSCLMHLEGILKRRKSAVRIIHVAQILNSSL